jgi:hypothetical protein
MTGTSLGRQAPLVEHQGVELVDTGRVHRALEVGHDVLGEDAADQ